jgi:hypothetical protein
VRNLYVGEKIAQITEDNFCLKATVRSGLFVFPANGHSFHSQSNHIVHDLPAPDWQDSLSPLHWNSLAAGQMTPFFLPLSAIAHPGKDFLLAD